MYVHISVLFVLFNFIILKCRVLQIIDLFALLFIVCPALNGFMKFSE